jgi:endonuclease YncB( thermonuclease family)
MTGRRDGVPAALSAGLIAVMSRNLSCAGAQGELQRAPIRGGKVIGRGSLSRVTDGRPFTLDDGRDVRLAGIEVRPLPETTTAPSGIATKNALISQLAGADTVLRRAEVVTDLYDCVPAYTAVAGDGGEERLQADLLGAGFARVAGGVAPLAYATELLNREKTARLAKLGLWTNPYYDLLEADNPADVLPSFALVEGKVVSVRESGATIYVNFGRRWTEDFTVTILKRNARSFAAAGLEPKQLGGTARARPERAPRRSMH